MMSLLSSKAKVIERPSEELELQLALVRAKMYLEKARDEPIGSALFLPLCYDAEVALSLAKKRIDDIKDISMHSLTTIHKSRQDMIARYGDLIGLLENRGFGKQAGEFHQIRDAFCEKSKMPAGHIQGPYQSPSSSIAARPGSLDTCEPHAVASGDMPTVWRLNTCESHAVASKDMPVVLSLDTCEPHAVASEDVPVIDGLDTSESHVVASKDVPEGGSLDACEPHAMVGKDMPVVDPSTPPERGSNVVTVFWGIFQSDARPPAIGFKPPELGARLDDTPQLACCLGLLKARYDVPWDVLDTNTREWLKWLETAKKDPDEEGRLMTLAKDVIRAFKRDELKDSKAVAEVAYLASVLEDKEFRYLVNEFCLGIERSTLLNVSQLEGLARLVQCTRLGYLGGDDFVKILNLLATRLRNTHEQSTDLLYPLTIAVSHVLDAMAAAGVRGVSREKIHEPLSSFLDGLRASPNPYLVYQAAYAYQALQYVPDDETPQQQVVRRFGKTLEGVSELAGAAKDLDYKKLISGLKSLREGLAVPEITRTIRHTSAEISSLMESGQSFRECLQGELSFTDQRPWYAALRGADALIRVGKFAQLRNFICKAPCRRDTAFLWGVCERLGEIAANPKWKPEIRTSAVLFLGEIYQNDNHWGRQVTIKQWILHILMQLSAEIDEAKALLQKLERIEDGMKRWIYQRCCENRGPGIHLMKAALPAIESPSLLDRVQERLDVEGQLRQLRGLRLKERRKDVYIQPQAKGNVHSCDEGISPLLEKVEAFLNSKQKVFLLLGESGAGKSTFTRELECHLWEAYKKGGTIPLFISLPAIDKPEHDMIAKRLRRAEFTEPQIRELKLYRKFILICDGYDESQQTHNLYTSNRLNRTGEWNAKMIISCRSEYIGADYRDRFQPVDRNRLSDPALFQEAVITPFSMSQIQEYIKQYVDKHRPMWEADDYKKALNLIPSLKELVTNPFLISLSLEVLPRMVTPGQDLSTTYITRASLYDQFIEHWFERGKKRLREKNMGPLALAAFEGLVDEGFTRNGIEFLKRLSRSIYKEQNGHPIVRYTRWKDQDTWKAEFFGREDEKQLLREACPLVRNGNQHRFIHRTLLEYGLSLAIFDPQDWKEETVPESALSRRGSSASMYDNQVNVSEIVQPEPDLNSPLAWRSFIREPSVLQFLEERVHHEPFFKQQLLNYIEHSKTDKKWRTAASNAITILVQSGVQFNGANLQGIQIPRADLSNGMFDSAQLQGADLNDVNLCGTWLKRADLTNADMTGVLLGEPLFLEHKDAVKWCLYSPCGNSIAVVLNNKTIRVYSTSPWNDLCTLDGFNGENESIVYSPNEHQLAFGGRSGTVWIWNIEKEVVCHVVLSGHVDKVTSVAYSPKGDRIASASLDTTIILWDVMTGNRLKTLTGHASRVNCVAFSPNGSQLASCSGGGNVRLWDVETGENKHVLGGHKESVMKVIYSPQGDRLVSFDQSTARLWNVEPGSCQFTSIALTLNSYTFHVFAFSPKGNQVASSFSDEVMLWSTETGRRLRILHGHNFDYDVSALAYSYQGDLIASASGDQTVRLWNTETGDSLRVLNGHCREVMSVAFSPKGDRIVSGSLDKTVRLWDVCARSSRQTLSSDSGNVTPTECSLRGDKIVSGSLDTTLRVLDIGDRSSRRTSSGHGGKVTQIKCSPTGDQIASCGHDRTVRLWDVETGACKHVLRGHSKPVFRIAYSPQGDQIATGSLDNTVRLWDVVTGDCISTLMHEDRVNGIAYSPPHGHQLASCSGDGTVRIWDVDSGECLRTLTGHIEGVWGVVYSPNGNQLATSSQDGIIRLWDVERGEYKPELRGPRQTMCRIVYSPQGDQIASYCKGRVVRLWCTVTGKHLRTLTYDEDDKDCKNRIDCVGSEHTYDVGQVHSVRYSPNINQIVAGYKDGAIRLWDTQTGNLLRTICGHQTMVNSSVYSEQGDLIISASDDKSVCLWDPVSGQCQAEIRDFQDWVNDIAWVTTPNGHHYVIAGCEDGVVGMWKVTKNTMITVDDVYQVHLHWRTTNGELEMKDAKVENVKGVRPLNEKILKQCGAVGAPAPFLRGKFKTVATKTSVISKFKSTSDAPQESRPSTPSIIMGRPMQSVEVRPEESRPLTPTIFVPRSSQSVEVGSEESRPLTPRIVVEEPVQHVKVRSKENHLLTRGVSVDQSSRRDKDRSQEYFGLPDNVPMKPPVQRFEQANDQGLFPGIWRLLDYLHPLVVAWFMFVTVYKNARLYLAKSP